MSQLFRSEMDTCTFIVFSHMSVRDGTTPLSRQVPIISRHEVIMTVPDELRRFSQHAAHVHPRTLSRPTLYTRIHTHVRGHRVASLLLLDFLSYCGAVYECEEDPTRYVQLSASMCTPSSVEFPQRTSRCCDCSADDIAQRVQRQRLVQQECLFQDFIITAQRSLSLIHI